MPIFEKNNAETWPQKPKSSGKGNDPGRVKHSSSILFLNFYLPRHDTVVRHKSVIDSTYNQFNAIIS